MKKHYRYDGEASGFIPGVGSVEPGTVIEATSDSHEEAIKASGHFKLDRPHKEDKPAASPAPKAAPKPEPKPDKPKTEPKAEDTGEGGKA